MARGSDGLTAPVSLTPSAFNPCVEAGGNVVAHVADALYRSKNFRGEGEDRGTEYAMGMEDTEVRLCYPNNCSLTVPGDLSGAVMLQSLKDLPDEDRFRWSIAIVGLRGHGKSALAGRMVRALGGFSKSALYRTRIAAGRYGGTAGLSLCPGDGPEGWKVRDAVWTMDHDTFSRRSGTSVEESGFPLLCDGQADCAGGFTLWDLPPFMDETMSPGDIPGRASLESRRKKTLGALQCLQPTTLIVTVAVDVTFRKEVLSSLVAQSVAACGPKLRRIIIAVTKMDRVHWNELSYQAAVGRAEAALCALLPRDDLASNSLFDFVSIPTSAANGQLGICSPCTPRTTKWGGGMGLPADSVLSALRFGMPSLSVSTDNPICAVHRVARAFSSGNSDVIVVNAIILRGLLRVGDKIVAWRGKNREAVVVVLGAQ